MSHSRTNLWLPAVALWRREIVRFLRQKNRVIGAFATPLVFWLLIGSGVGPGFRLPGLPADMTYLAYFFPGTVVLILLFTAIFSTISIIEDRREGFLQGVLVAPVAPEAIVLGKFLGGMTLAAGQALLFCLAAPLAGLPFDALVIARLVPALLVVEHVDFVKHHQAGPLGQAVAVGEQLSLHYLQIGEHVFGRGIHQVQQQAGALDVTQKVVAKTGAP